MADDAEAKADPGILSRRIYYKTYCGEDGDKRTYVVHTLKADLLQARGSQHKRCNREGIEMNLREAAEMALKVLTDYVEDPRCQKEIDQVAEALRQALSVPEKPDNWVGLTDEEIESELTKEFGQWWSRHVSVCRAIEAKLKEKNGG